eukprot:scaffold9668_cov35-Tisochrysis_lutea.AAC.2
MTRTTTRSFARTSSSTTSSPPFLTGGLCSQNRCAMCCSTSTGGAAWAAADRVSQNIALRATHAYCRPEVGVTSANCTSADTSATITTDAPDSRL